MATSIIRQLQRTSKTILHLQQQPKIKLKHYSYCTTNPIIKPHDEPIVIPVPETPEDPEQPDNPFHLTNLLKLLRYEIQYEIDTSPPFKPVSEFNSFSVEEKPTEQWVRLARKFGENEEIKIEATMFDVSVNNIGMMDPKFYASMLVGISKGEGNDLLEFVCSVWPGRIKIHEVYTRNEKQAGKPYMGPGFKDLDDKLQSSLYKYLEERGIDVKLATFLHEYMKNKEKYEFCRWMERVKSFIEKKSDIKIVK